MKAKPSFLSQKNELAQMILALQDESVLRRIQAILYEETTDPSDLKGIDKGLEDLKSGRVMTAEEFLKDVEKL